MKHTTLLVLSSRRKTSGFKACAINPPFQSEHSCQLVHSGRVFGICPNRNCHPSVESSRIHVTLRVPIHSTRKTRKESGTYLHGVELDTGLDDIDGRQGTVGDRAADTACRGTLQVVHEAILGAGGGRRQKGCTWRNVVVGGGHRVSKAEGFD